jgi:hypothetical protein
MHPSPNPTTGQLKCICQIQVSCVLQSPHRNVIQLWVYVSAEPCCRPSSAQNHESRPPSLQRESLRGIEHPVPMCLCKGPAVGPEAAFATAGLEKLPLQLPETSSDQRTHRARARRPCQASLRAGGVGAVLLAVLWITDTSLPARPDQIRKRSMAGDGGELIKLDPKCRLM